MNRPWAKEGILLFYSESGFEPDCIGLTEQYIHSYHYSSQESLSGTEISIFSDQINELDA